jgi:hypothetical protein
LATFTPQVARGPLARQPYDLRHAAVSTWLAAGVLAATVAQWAGQSVAVLLEAYASFLDGGRRLPSGRSSACSALRRDQRAHASHTDTRIRPWSAGVGRESAPTAFSLVGAGFA